MNYYVLKEPPVSINQLLCRWFFTMLGYTKEKHKYIAPYYVNQVYIINNKFY